MNSKFEKVLDSSRRIVVDLKRKQSDGGIISSAGGSQLLIPLHSVPRHYDHNLTKRRKLDGPKTKCCNCGFTSGKHLLKNYNNFKKTGILHRLMYYYNDEWNDFSQDVIAFANKDLLSQKPVIEVEVNENKVLLDFLHMMLIDLNTGLHQSIAWIDVSGKCFFPEVVNECDELRNCHNEIAVDDWLVTEPQESNNINLHLEIEIHGGNDESSGESNVIVEQVEVHENDALDINSYARASNMVVDDKLVNNQPIEENMIMMHDPVPGSLDSDTIKKIFFKTISSTDAEIVEVLHGMSNTRLELFMKQAEMTRRCRGDANIRYAWLPCSSRVVSSILKYGVSHYESFKTKLLYGAGIYLIPANGTQTRIQDFDVDENETRHMVLCRVIMGNMEPICCGSRQFHPSSDEFDSGVDNVQNPKHYVIWTMNMNSHIFPECVVSFKMISDSEELVFGKERVDQMSFGTCFEGPHAAQMYGLPNQAKGPKSPWMPFPMLFAAISSKIIPRNMELVKINYVLFRNKRFSRDEFVRRLRVIVGDDLLKAAITSLQAKMSYGSDVETA
ncbi:inactive poly [ADP-ribose] polymerase RCD1 [Andrographis paniculata]|uniref:inactive poly [ADP-ribose] polymerase RCD1 n=1 Tax=Andrographis paniculata TaxID=175694 RepID=UPI0021E97AC2|nr:inactive poly [ADP-ribose] polymerase RCD1 [Andrographis paniculata]XP_051136909.1 inactive poly [ADP-ribose] polymerase RCD1 [Andrographis paniculata]XP_051136910.1 inactive poly [ADP-ribose] polymerase RCD1 [Andrographis paniculata]